MKRKGFLKGGIVVLALIMLFGGAALATDGTKNIQVRYKNIKTFVNSTLKAPSQEPFIYNDSTYVPLRFISESLGAVVNWDANTNTIAINLGADPAEVEALKSEIIQKNNQLILLQTKVDSLQKELDKETSSEKKLEKLEEDLMRSYGKLKSVKIDSIELKSSKDKVTVWVETDLYKKNLDYWASLKDKDIEKWVKDLVSDIQSEYGKSIEVVGTIYDLEEREDIVEFKQDGTKTLKVDFYDSYQRSSKGSIESVEDDLLDSRWRIGGYYFALDYIYYDTRYDEIHADLYYDGSGRFDSRDWANLTDVDYDIEKLCGDLVYDFEDNANAKPKTVYLRVLGDRTSVLQNFEFDTYNWRLK